MCATVSADDKYRGNKNRGRSFTGISLSPAGVGLTFASNGFGINIAPGTLRGIHSQGIIGQQFIEPAPNVAPFADQPFPVAPSVYGDIPPGYRYDQPPVDRQPTRMPTPTFSNPGWGPSPTPATTPIQIQKPVPSKIDQPVPSQTPVPRYRESAPELSAPESVLVPRSTAGSQMYSVLEK
jgi:hypothetical protein